MTDVYVLVWNVVPEYTEMYVFDATDKVNQRILRGAHNTFINVDGENEYTNMLNTIVDSMVPEKGPVTSPKYIIKGVFLSGFLL